MSVRAVLVVAGLLVLMVMACGSEAGPAVTIGEDIEISLAQACVVPGGEQTLTVRAPHPALASFQAVYSDGKNGGPEPGGGGYGGEGLEIVPDSGVTEMKWRVSRNAPPGAVTVAVRIQQEEQRSEELEFTLAGPGKAC